MNEAKLHLVLNHFPIIVLIVGLIVLICGFFLKSALIRRVSYFIFIGAALITIVVFATGEGAEEVLEKVSDTDETYIKTHEERAEIFALLTYILGAFALLTLWANWKNKAYAKLLSSVVLFFAVVNLFYAKKAGETGGEIRHTEIRNEASNPSKIQNTSHVKNDEQNE